MNNLNKINENVKNTNIPVSVWNNSSAIGTARVDNKIEQLPESIKDAIADHFIKLSVDRTPEQLNTTMTVIPMTARGKRPRNNTFIPNVPNIPPPKRPTRVNNNNGFAPRTPTR